VLRVCVRVCVCVCMRACTRACVCEYLHAYVRVSRHDRVSVYVCGLCVCGIKHIRVKMRDSFMLN